MKRHQKPTSTTLLLATLLAAFGIASAVESSEANDTNTVKTFVVAGTEFFDPNQATKFSKATLEAIRKAVYPRPLVVVHSNVEELNDAVRKSAVNLVIAGPAVYRGNIQSGIRDVATTINNLQPDPDKAIGSLILARKDDGSINRIEDLRGKKIGTNVEHGFQGDLVIRKELFDRGLPQDDFFGSVRYYGLDPSKRLEALKDGEVDAVIVNSCYLEREALKGNNILEGLKTVGEKEQTDSFCKTSTKLYPNYSVLIPPGTPNQTIVKIVDALFSMQKGDDGSGWTIAGDFGSTDKLYKDLAFGPYAYLKSWTLNRLWNEYRSWVLFFLFAICFLVFHTVRTSYLIKVKTRQLRISMLKLRRSSERAKRISEKFQRIQRAYSVSQLSSMVAHELSQPLGGISLYVAGMKKLVEDQMRTGKLDSPLMLQTLDYINRNLEMTTAIIDKVRSYARGERQTKEVFNVVECIRKAVESSKLIKDEIPVKILFHSELSEALVDGSPLEMELAVINLIKNSIEAGRKDVSLEIRVIVAKVDSSTIKILVQDNGKGMVLNKTQDLASSLSSTKHGGIGLGLAIVSKIVEKFQGSLRMETNDTGGVTTTMVIPVYQGQTNHA